MFMRICLWNYKTRRRKTSYIITNETKIKTIKCLWQKSIFIQINFNYIEQQIKIKKRECFLRLLGKEK